MYRILKADKDAYVTNKLLFSSRPTLSRSTDANVGAAASLDLYKLYDETDVPSGSSGVELTRMLIHFDLSPLRELTGSYLNYSSSSFKAYISLKDVYSGKTVPSNFTIVAYPVAKTWDEGRGMDVIGYRDLDVVNWFTASISNGAITTWTSGGIAYAGDLSGSATGSFDYFNTSTLPAYPSGVGSIARSQSFTLGTEDLLIDVTPVVSGVLAGLIPDYGFRLSFSGSQETDDVTRFVKRFASRHTKNSTKHPRLIVKYDDSFFDNQASPYFDYSNKIGLYYNPFGVATNFLSGSTVVSGSGSILLELIASKSAYVTATTYSSTHQMSISYTSASWNRFSFTATGSQVAYGGFYQSGSYYADVYLNFSTAGLSGVLDTQSQVKFLPVWKSTDGTVIYTTGSYLTFKRLQGNGTSIPQRNYLVTVPNLKDSYISSDVAKLKVLVTDYDPTLESYFMPGTSAPRVFPTMYWRVIDPYTKDILIPFDIDDNGTRMSADGQGMNFKLYMSDLPLNRPLELQFLIKEFGSSYLIENQGFLFRVVTV
jgi:hypothetical protein